MDIIKNGSKDRIAAFYSNEWYENKDKASNQYEYLQIRRAFLQEAKGYHHKDKSKGVRILTKMMAEAYKIETLDKHDKLLAI